MTKEEKVCKMAIHNYLEQAAALYSDIKAFTEDTKVDQKVKNQLLEAVESAHFTYLDLTKAEIEFKSIYEEEI